MKGYSNIEWTDRTWNIVTGCTRISPGCDHCYMFREYPRLHGMGVPGYEYEADHVQCLPKRLDNPRKWQQCRVFVCSMADLFHHEVPYEFLDRAFDVMAETAESRNHTFQILTKRPGRAVGWWNKKVGEGWHPDIWMGTSVESQKYAPRLTVLERIPAPVKFVSVEPMLGSVDLSSWLERDAVQWVICGGESGPGARDMDLDWARSLRDQCQEAGVAFFLKQLGGVRDKRSGEKAELDGQLWQAWPLAGR